MSHRRSASIAIVADTQHTVDSVVRVLLRFVCVLFALLSIAPEVHAQIRWDIGARVGAGKRYQSSQGSNSPDSDAGPAAELTLHTALLPLLRVGPSISAEVSPVAGRPTRRHYGAGIEARLFAPLPWPKLRPFAYVGVRGVMARQPETELHAAGGGGYMSVPFGVGASIYVLKSLRCVATFGGEGAFFHGGTLYDAKNSQYIGNDVAAIRGMVGADLEF